MSEIRRFPPAYEQSLWPDALPAAMTIPAGFVLHVPSDLSLSGVTLTVHGTVSLPPAPVALPDASDTAPGLVELATQAEVDAGSDALRAVTPATLAGWVDLLFDDATFTPGAAGSTRDVTIGLTLRGAAVDEQAVVQVACVGAADFELAVSLTLSVSTGTLWQANGSPATMVVAATTGAGALVVGLAHSGEPPQTVRMVALMPFGRLAVSDAIVMDGFQL